jgi:Fe-coproporphyrin III synthase
MNTQKHIELIKNSWGGINTIPAECTSCAILSLDHKEQTKHPCCIGSSDTNALKLYVKSAELDVIPYW